MFRLSLGKVVLIIVVACVVIAIVVLAPPQKYVCDDSICTSVEYTCTDEVRTSLRAEVRNRTSEAVTLTILQNNGKEEATHSFPLTQKGTDTSGYRLDKPVQQEYPYTFRFEIGGKVVASGGIKPGDRCKPEDTRK